MPKDFNIEINSYFEMLFLEILFKSHFVWICYFRLMGIDISLYMSQVPSTWLSAINRLKKIPTHHFFFIYEMKQHS